MPLHLTFLHRTAVPYAASVLLLAAPVGASAASAQGRGPDDLKTLSSYRLTMPTLRKVLGALREADADPEARRLREQRAKTKSWPDFTKMSIAELAAELELVPARRRALARAGVSTREAATVYASLMHAMRSLAQQESARSAGGPAPAPPPAGALRDNVELIRQHQAELARLSGRGGAR